MCSAELTSIGAPNRRGKPKRTDLWSCQPVDGKSPLCVLIG